MVKSELNSVKLSSTGEQIREDLPHSVEMFNSVLKETATVMTKTVRGWPSQTYNNLV